MSLVAKLLFQEIAARQSAPPDEAPPPGGAPPPDAVPDGLFIPPPDYTVEGDPRAQRNIRTLYAVATFAIVLAVLPVVARLCFRRTQKLGWKLDDYAIIVAAAITIADASCFYALIQFGFGQPLLYILGTVPPTAGIDDIETIGQIAFVTFLLYGAGVTWVKYSVLAFYDRIFPRQKFKWWLISLGVASTVWWIIVSFVIIFQCDPVQGSWEVNSNADCLPNYLDLFIAFQVLNIVLEISILVLPMRAVSQLQMARHNKISVAGTFALGGLSIVFAIVRMGILIRDRNKPDLTYEIDTASWSLIEPAFEIFCACLPCMAPVLRFTRRLVGLSSTVRSGGSKATGDSSTGQSGNRSNHRPFHPTYHPDEFDPYNQSYRLQSSDGQPLQDLEQGRKRELDNKSVDPASGYYLADVSPGPGEALRDINHDVYYNR